MSDQADRETLGDEYGVWSVDAEDQLQPSDTLDGDDDTDVLDRGYRTTDGYRWTGAYSDEEETIDQRIRQEEEDPDSAYGAPRNESGLDDDGRLGGEDGIWRDEDHVGGTGRVGRLVAPDEGRYPDRESMAVAHEGRASSWDTPEESAMHYIDDPEADEELTEAEWQPEDDAGRDEEE